MWSLPPALKLRFSLWNLTLTPRSFQPFTNCFKSTKLRARRSMLCT
ncbi:hypothetical protein VEx25_2056 [Vibrio antiquarius]|uniref:Uncharacterized protein n=1 Tax=Vibrio antiquarius (strain Ex25) TaxID=150340 RepID=A0ABM9WRY6_VIBAE|nr:hypothetical protein VEx25_2056 [Vibrio antiquarius]